jgi:hypothetical protein
MFRSPHNDRVRQTLSQILHEPQSRIFPGGDGAGAPSHFRYDVAGVENEWNVSEKTPPAREQGARKCGIDDVDHVRRKDLELLFRLGPR